ncbi:DNA-directed RNA polymerase subunit alpha [bacterium]|nr:DNA-directed RNA polymerase subunit alpha [bacterium]
MTQIILPEKISIKDKKNNNYEVVIEPFYPGFGETIGNSLRRVLLSYLDGAAVTSFKIDGAQHEFDSIEYVKEDLIEIMLNLKLLRLKSFSTQPVRLSLEAKGEKTVTAADIKKNSDVEIINKDLVIATLTDKSAKISMEVIVEQGRGYVTVEQRDETKKLEIGQVAIDASFSPVLNVGFKMDNVRVGEMTNYEKLTMNILTDGTTDAKEAISQAAVILQDHFNVFINSSDAVEEKETAKEDKKSAKKTIKKTTKVKADKSSSAKATDDKEEEEK